MVDLQQKQFQPEQNVSSYRQGIVSNHTMLKNGANMGDNSESTMVGLQSADERTGGKLQGRRLTPVKVVAKHYQVRITLS